MAKSPRLERARKAFADLTGQLEDASLRATDGQVAPDLADARRTCDRLVAVLEPCLDRLHRLRRQLG